MDDIGLTDTGMDGLVMKTKQADKVLEHTSMKIKKWIFSGDDQNNIKVGSIMDKLTTKDVELERVLGVLWNPRKGVFKFSVKINLRPNRKVKSRTRSN